MARFFCPFCRSIRESNEEMLACEECMEDMLKIEERFTDLLKGKEIAFVALEPRYGGECGEHFKEGEDVIERGLHYDGGRIYLIFKDGSMLEAWNSEWGGIDYIEIRKNEVKERKTAFA
jgi:hypothetical protein